MVLRVAALLEILLGNLVSILNLMATTALNDS